MSIVSSLMVLAAAPTPAPTPAPAGGGGGLINTAGIQSLLLAVGVILLIATAYTFFGHSRRGNTKKIATGMICLVAGLFVIGMALVPNGIADVGTAVFHLVTTF